MLFKCCDDVCVGPLTVLCVATSVLQVVLSTGTIVKVKASGLFLDVWIIASSLDYGKTEGQGSVFHLHE